VGFIGARPSEVALRTWLAHLQSQATGTLTLGRNLSKGFFTIKTTAEEAVKELFLLSPHRSPVGLYVFQYWVADFDPEAAHGIAASGKRATNGLKIPTWIPLRHLKDELRGVAQEIAEGVEELVGATATNYERIDPRFCVLIPSGLGWESSIIVENYHTKTEIEILIDYDNLPIRYKFCFATDHCLRDC
jgi:hypothetical protein